MKTPHLTRAELAWLKAYCKALAEQYPGVVERMLLYGSKASGDAGPESDVDILLIIRNADATKKKRLRWIGHLLAATSDAVPSIFVYTEDEWEYRRKIRSPFRAAVERDAVSLL